MSPKKDWRDTREDVNKLSLDLQNPRLPQYVKDYKDVNQIRAYFLEKEDVLKIARSIANYGYHRSAVSIVCEEKGKLIVLDGNRRLVACQLLLNPKLASTIHARKEFEKLNKIFDKKQLESIKITIAPSRREAEKEIWDIHVNQLLKPWQVLQKLRMYRNLINARQYTIASASLDYGISEKQFKQELAKLYFYEKILGQLEKEEEEDELLKSGFNKIDRLILSTNGRRLLDYSVDSKGKIIINNQEGFDKKFKNLIPYIVIKNKVNPQATQPQLEKDVFSVLDPINFPKEIAQAKRAKFRTLAKPDWITRGEYLTYKGAERVKRMLGEMYKLKPDKNRNILIVSLRVLLELFLYYKLQETGYIAKMEKNYKCSVKTKNKKRAKNRKPLIEPKHNWSPSFREMLDYIFEASNNVISDPQARDALEEFVKGEKNFVEDLNAFVHNVHSIPAKGDPEKIWGQFGRLLFDVISKIR